MSLVPGQALARHLAERAVDHTLTVSEVFGPTLQGEGRNLGRRAGFVRLGGCNLHCSWCDTPYTWDASRYDLRAELRREPVQAIVDQLAAMTPEVVVVTGGEPLLQQRQPAWDQLLTGLWTVDVEVETNGTVIPSDFSADNVELWNVSPKLAHNGDPEHLRINRGALEAFADLALDNRAVLKVVCRTPDDVDQAAALAGSLGWPAGQVYVMPEGTTADQVVAGHQLLADAVIAAGVGMTTRLHTLVWGQERAR